MEQEDYLLREALKSKNFSALNGSHPEELDPASRISLAVVLSVLILLTLVGNTLVLIVIFRHRGMRTRTNMFLFNLAAAQLLTALCDMPFAFLTAILGQWVFGDVLCVISGIMSPVLFTVCLQTLMYISIHKCISIRKPTSQLLTRTRVWILLTTSWLVGALAGFLAGYGFTVIRYQSGRIHCTAALPFSEINKYFYCVCQFVLYCVPITVICICYAAVFREMRIQYDRIEKSVASRRDVIFLQQQRITTTLFIVMVIYVFFSLPYLILSIYETFNWSYHVLNKLAYCCLYVSCVFNPLVYALRSPAFREGYKQLLCSNSSSLANEGSDPNLAAGNLKGFRSLLRDSFPPSLHGSGSVGGSSYNVSSRKSSLSSIAQYLLFPKSKSLSTSSLPRNFRYSVHSIDAVDTTQVSIICGVPVLTKHGKIVAYCDPTQPQRKKANKSPVFYPSTVAPRICFEPESSTSQEPDEKFSEEITDAEHSPLLMPNERTMFAFDVNAVIVSRGQQRSSISSAIVADVASSKRNSVSAESGFVEESTVHTIEACSPTALAMTTTQQLRPLVSNMMTDEEKENDNSVGGATNTLAGSISFLAVPQPLSPILKSNSETCIRTSSTEDTKRGSDPSTSKGRIRAERKSVIQRLFSSMRHKKSDEATTSVKAIETKESPQTNSPKPSPSPQHKPQNFLPVTFQSNISKSASDTCLGGLPWEDHQTKRPKKRMSEKARKSDQKIVKRGSQRGAKTKDDTWWNVEHHYVETSMRRTMSAKYKAERCPSIETLHSQGGLKRCVSDVGHKKHQRRKLKPPDNAETAKAKKAEITNALKNKPMRAPTVPTGALYRAISDPAFTFTMLEEKVHQRHLVKQWNKRKLPATEGGAVSKNLEVPNIMVELVDNSATGLATFGDTGNLASSTSCLSTTADNSVLFGGSTDALQSTSATKVDLFLSKMPIGSENRMRSGIMKKNDTKHLPDERKCHVKINENGLEHSRKRDVASRPSKNKLSTVPKSAMKQSSGGLRPNNQSVNLSQSVGSNLDMAGASNETGLSSAEGKCIRFSSELCLFSNSNVAQQQTPVIETVL